MRLPSEGKEMPRSVVDAPADCRRAEVAAAAAAARPLRPGVDLLRACEVRDVSDV